MIKSTSRLMMTAAAASMAFAPIAAQANTRAGDSAPVYTSASAQPGLARAAEGEEARRGAGTIIIAVLAAAAVIAGIILLADNEDDDVSPGT